MNCYVVCENVYRDDALQSVNIIGAGETIEDAKALIESNREELKRLFDGKFIADFYDFCDADGAHVFRTADGIVYRTCVCKTKYRKMAAKEMRERCEKIVNDLKFALQETITMNCSYARDHEGKESGNLNNVKVIIERSIAELRGNATA